MFKYMFPKKKFLKIAIVFILSVIVTILAYGIIVNYFINNEISSNKSPILVLIFCLSCSLISLLNALHQHKKKKSIIKIVSLMILDVKTKYWIR